MKSRNVIFHPNAKIKLNCLHKNLGTFFGASRPSVGIMAFHEQLLFGVSVPPLQLNRNALRPSSEVIC